MKAAKFFSLSILGLLAVAPFSSAIAEQIEISGSTTVQKRIIEPNVGAVKGATGVDVKFYGVGTGKGVVALIEGKAQAAAASETLDEAVASAKKVAAEAGNPLTVPGNLVFSEITKDSLAVIVNKDNPVASLTKAQLKDINTGKVKNWKEVGGPDLAISVITSHAGSATRSVFQKQIMDGADYVTGATEVRTTRDEITMVSKNPGGIGAVSEAFLEQNPGKAKTVKAPTISRPLGLITIDKPKPEVQKVLDFFKTAEGKKLIQ